MKKYLTLQGLKKLKKELEYLKDVKRKEVAENLKQAISQGDLRENAGYDAAKNEQGFIECRIKELEEVISQSEVIEKKESNNVQIGSFVSLSSNDGEEKFQIVGPEEADILENKISFKSPLGEAIYGKKKGEVVKVSAPGGKKEYKITEIE